MPEADPASICRTERAGNGPRVEARGDRGGTRFLAIVRNDWNGKIAACGLSDGRMGISLPESAAGG